MRTMFSCLPWTKWHRRRHTPTKLFVTLIPATYVSESDMMAVLRSEFPKDTFKVELRNDFYLISAPRVLSEVSCFVVDCRMEEDSRRTDEAPAREGQDVAQVLVRAVGSGSGEGGGHWETRDEAFSIPPQSEGNGAIGAGDMWANV